VRRSGRPAGGHDLDALLEAWSAWSGPPERCDGAWRVPGGPLPLALDDALWAPAPRAIEAAVERDEDLLIAPGAPAEEAARAAGYRPWLAVRADDPFAGPDAGGETPRVDVDDAAPRRWDAARAVAELLLAGDPDALADAPADAEGQVGAMAAALAAAAEADEGVALHLTGARTTDRAAAVSVTATDAFAIVAAGGTAAPLAARLLDDARALGRRTFWTRTCDLDDPAAWLRRWTRNG
jgi:hypothetical protein